MSDNREDSSRFRDALEEKVKSAEDVNKRQSGPAGETPRSEPRQAARQAAQLLNEPIALGGPSLPDMAAFCRQLATLLDVGIPLVRSLRILAERSQHPRLRRVAAAVARDVEEGHRLSDAMASHPRIFSALVINTVRVGEAGGILETALNRLADTMEQKLDIRRKVAGALAYPVVALIVGLTVLIVILVVAIPVFAEVYKDLPNAELPKITQRVIGLSEFAQKYWVVGVPLIIAAIAALWLFGFTHPGKRIYDWLRLYTPIVGRINIKINVARFARTLGNLLNAGVPLLEGLGICSRTAENLIIRDALKRAHDNVERGGKLEEPLRRDRSFPPMVVDMIAIGDEAGALDTMLLKVADIYDSDVDTTLRGLASLIEPVLIVLLGCMVLVIALAVLMPYFSLARFGVAE